MFISSNWVAATILGAGAMNYTANKNDRQQTIKGASGEETKRGFDRFGGAWMSKYERDYYGDASNIPQIARHTQDPSMRFIDRERAPVKPSTIRAQAELKRSAMSSITENPWGHRSSVTGGKGFLETVTDGRHGFHSSAKMQKRASGTGNFSEPLNITHKDVPAAYGRLNERWFEMRR